MILRKLYYALKPVIPWRVRIGGRRLRAKWYRTRSLDRWPISPNSWLPPKNWPGWPGGKRFAVVLTHDVESNKGVERTLQLAGAEEALGFRSSFNFVPEGYQTPRELREELSRRGFEVGVHGLKHDGKLYNSREIFHERAQRINHYLKDWNAVGFRSPFMHHNLEWIHDLNIRYDASTFDTDPFEPQPEGENTIFPFWVSRPDGGGYLELPYTLVQDFNLFTILQEKTIAVWKQKLDWIAERGGMALLNTHPDYVHFGEGHAPEGEFHVELYRELLQYIADRYKGDYWHALPREVADYCTPLRPLKTTPSGKRVCMLTYSFYESDTRVRRYGEALAERGNDVDVLALSDPGANHPKFQQVNGVNLFRLQNRPMNEKGLTDFFWRIGQFWIRGMRTISLRHLRRRYDVFHIHNLPDFLVFTAWLPRLMGAKVILDIHDVMPELFVSKFHAAERGVLFHVLRCVEWCSTNFANHVIIANDLWFEKLTKRAVSPSRCTSMVNYIDLRMFHPCERTRSDGKFIVIFPGSLQWHQGLDIAIRAFAIFRNRVTNAEFHIYGKGGTESELRRLVMELGLNGSVIFFSPVDGNKIPQILANADMGIVPKRADSFGNQAYSTKIMEFMSQSVPVVVSRTKIDNYYFSDRLVRFFESGNAADLACGMIEVAENREFRDQLVANSLDYIRVNSWEAKKERYLDLVDALDAKSGPTSDGAVND